MKAMNLASANSTPPYIKEALGRQVARHILVMATLENPTFREYQKYIEAYSVACSKQLFTPEIRNRMEVALRELLRRAKEAMESDDTTSHLAQYTQFTQDYYNYLCGLYTSYYNEGVITDAGYWARSDECIGLMLDSYLITKDEADDLRYALKELKHVNDCRLYSTEGTDITDIPWLETPSHLWGSPAYNDVVESILYASITGGLLSVPESYPNDARLNPKEREYLKKCIAQAKQQGVAMVFWTYSKEAQEE